MDIQPVFNKYKAVAYMCQYFSKTENNMHHHDIMKTIAKAYLSNRECSVQEAAYGPSLPIFPGISRFSIYPPGLPKIRIPQCLIIFCNNFPEETKVKRGDSHCVIFFTFKRRRHSTTQVVAPYLTRKYFVLRNIILLYVPFFIF